MAYRKDYQLVFHRVDIRKPVFAISIHDNILPTIQDLGDVLRTEAIPGTSVRQWVRSRGCSFDPLTQYRVIHFIFYL